MSNLKIVVDRDIPFMEGVFTGQADVVSLPGAAITAADVRDADGLIVRTRTRCDGELLEGSRVQAVATATIGYDHIDREYCRQSGIAWSNAPGCNAGGVVQYVLSVFVSLSCRGLLPEHPVVGVIGCGAVGSRVAAAFRTVGCDVLENDPPRMAAEQLDAADGFYSLEETVRRADFLTLHPALSYGGRWPSFHLINNRVLQLCKPGALLLNAARGEVVDSRALSSGLQHNRPAAAVLDVWEDEPLIDRSLQELAVVGTPHIAGYSAEGKRNGTVAAVQFIAERLGLTPPDDFPRNAPRSGELLLPEAAAADWRDAVQFTYDVRVDHRRLLEDPAGFERFRSAYRLRREFSAYRLPDRHDPLLPRLGFVSG